MLFTMLAEKACRKYYPVAMDMPSARSWFLMLFSNERKMSDSRTGNIPKMTRLKHLIMPDIKEGIKDKNTKQNM